MSKHCLLVVEDDPVYMEMLVGNLEDCGYEVLQAETGAAAWQAILSHDGVLDAVLLDRLLPDMDSLSLVGQMKADARLAHIPVIIQTSMTEADEVAAGLSAGAYYYLTKPYKPEALRALVKAVLTDRSERDLLRETSARLHMSVCLLKQGVFSFRTVEEARALAISLANLCADSSASAMGLVELLVNAVEHGNLGITYAEKAQLRMNYGWDDEVSRRLTLAPWSERRASIAVKRDGKEVEFTITDEGAGFDWKPYLELDPARAFDLNGRGIAMARMLGFNSIEYQGAGNIVVARAAAQNA